MRQKLLFLSLFWLIGVAGWSQSQYSVISNRVIFSTLVNNDTLLIENPSNDVRVNGQIGLVEVIYHHLGSRVMNQKTQEIREPSLDFEVKFYGEYLWLDERIKNSVNEMSFMDHINVHIVDYDLDLPVDFKIFRIRSTKQLFTVMIEISGVMPPEPLEEHFPELNFHNDIPFKIILTVEATN
jgi:hypothetical protein